MYCCDYCGKILYNIPYTCHRCGYEFCSEHQLPKNHKCTGLPEVRNPLLLDEENYEIIRVIKPVPDPLIAYGRRQSSELVETLGLRNPLLLGVKMFLAEIPYVIKGYYDLDKNNCFKFSKDVQDAATRRGIRCGLVIISFHKNLTGHAIVAFETDYGLKFFEPQSANEEDVIVGRSYSASLSGISDDDIIIKYEIIWNDGTNTIIG
jgi:hypothetical protein